MWATTVTGWQKCRAFTTSTSATDRHSGIDHGSTTTPNVTGTWALRSSARSVTGPRCPKASHYSALQALGTKTACRRDCVVHIGRRNGCGGCSGSPRVRSHFRWRPFLSSTCTFLPVRRNPFHPESHTRLSSSARFAWWSSSGENLNEVARVRGGQRGCTNCRHQAGKLQRTQGTLQRNPVSTLTIPL